MFFFSFSLFKKREKSAFQEKEKIQFALLIGYFYAQYTKQSKEL